eukprot:gene7765-8576_t
MALVRNLFGGAITSTLTNEFEDASKLRDVPDHQEVFVDLKKPSDASLIVELLDLDRSVPDAEAIRFHFEELGRSNEAVSNLILAEGVPAGEPLLPQLGGALPVNPRMALIGVQQCRKHHSPSAPLDTVYIFMILVRLKEVGTDLLITLNLPTALSEQGHRVLNQNLSLSLLRPGTNYDLPYPGWERLAALQTFLQTFHIVDWGLFSP